MLIPLSVMYVCRYSTSCFISRNIDPISAIWFGTRRFVTNADASRFL